VNFRERWYRHRWSLNRGRHRNPHLQQAWVKYGEANFEFSILEFVERDHLLAAEQVWIDRTGCAERTLGFNAYDVAGSPGETNARDWEGFILDEFCRENGLHPVKMRHLKSGRIQRYKGWTWKEENEHDE
jgi:group I intron endonuclease